MTPRRRCAPRRTAHRPRWTRRPGRATRPRRLGHLEILRTARRPDAQRRTARRPRPTGGLGRRIRRVRRARHVGHRAARVRRGAGRAEPYSEYGGLENAPASGLPRVTTVSQARPQGPGVLPGIARTWCAPPGPAARFPPAANARNVQPGSSAVHRTSSPGCREVGTGQVITGSADLRAAHVRYPSGGLGQRERHQPVAHIADVDRLGTEPGNEHHGRPGRPGEDHPQQVMELGGPQDRVRKAAARRSAPPRRACRGSSRRAPGRLRRSRCRRDAARVAARAASTTLLVAVTSAHQWATWRSARPHQRRRSRRSLPARSAGRRSPSAVRPGCLWRLAAT